MGLNNPSIHFVQYVRWKIFPRILNKSKGSISLGLDSIDMLVPVEFTVYLNIPLVYVYMKEIVPARRDIPPCRVGVKISWGIKLLCMCKPKIVCASIGSQGIPARRDISVSRIGGISRLGGSMYTGPNKLITFESLSNSNIVFRLIEI